MVALIFSTSCLNGGSSHGGSSSATEPGYYTSYTIDDSGIYTPVYTNDKEASVTMLIPDILTPSMDVTLRNVKMVNGMPPQNITFPSLAFTKVAADDGINYVIDAKDIVPKVADTEYADYKVRYIRVSVGTKVVVDIEFESLPYRLIFHSERWNATTTIYIGGMKTVNNATSSESVIYEEPEATVTVVKKGTAATSQSFDITFNGVKFAAAMPALNITFPGLTFTRMVTLNGINYTIDAQNIVPKIGDVEYPDYKVDYIKAELGSEAAIEFDMATMPYKVIFNKE
jgi:hypothetical protein